MSLERIHLKPESKELFKSYCDSKEIHSVLNVTYKDVAERVISWLHRQPVETWNEVIKILETEILASKDKCFTGRLSRLVSCLDGFHPGVRISIATADQISNRVLLTIKKCKEENLDKETTIQRVIKELKELDLSEADIEAWLTTVRETFDDE